MRILHDTLLCMHVWSSIGSPSIGREMASIVHFIVTFCNMKMCKFFGISPFWDGAVLDLPFLDGGRSRSPFPEILDLTLK